MVRLALQKKLSLAFSETKGLIPGTDLNLLVVDEAKALDLLTKLFLSFIPVKSGTKKS